MKNFIILILAYLAFAFVFGLLLSSTALAGTQHWCYPYENLKVTVQADTESEGMLKAGRICFKALTKGKYPGEEAGLTIIDICAAPRKCVKGQD